MMVILFLSRSSHIDDFVISFEHFVSDDPQSCIRLGQFGCHGPSMEDCCSLTWLQFFFKGSSWLGVVFGH